MSQKLRLPRAVCSMKVLTLRGLRHLPKQRNLCSGRKVQYGEKLILRFMMSLVSWPHHCSTYVPRNLHSRNPFAEEISNQEVDAETHYTFLEVLGAGWANFSSNWRCFCLLLNEMHGTSIDIKILSSGVYVSMCNNVINGNSHHFIEFRASGTVKKARMKNDEIVAVKKMILAKQPKKELIVTEIKVSVVETIPQAELVACYYSLKLAVIFPLFWCT